jgi:hypothetical protein
MPTAAEPPKQISTKSDTKPRPRQIVTGLIVLALIITGIGWGIVSVGHFLADKASVSGRTSSTDNGTGGNCDGTSCKFSSDTNKALSTPPPQMPQDTHPHFPRWYL